MIPSKEENPNGLHSRYIVQKADGSPVDPGASYFVLRIDLDGDDRHRAASYAAMAAYADRIEQWLPDLANDLRQRLHLPPSFVVAWNALAFYAHRIAVEHGFYDFPSKTPSDGDIAIWMMNVVAELGEGWEGFRCGEKDSHLPHRDSLEVEFADVVLRLMSTASVLDYDLPGAIVEKNAYNKDRPYKHGGKRF